MSRRDWKILCEDILEAISKCQSYTFDLSYEDFTIQFMVIDAGVRNLEIIGEAANRIPEEIQLQFTKIPWRQIIGLRNRIIHEYFGVDIANIWFIVINELPTLKKNIEIIFDNE